jgi:hypothetical protein
MRGEESSGIKRVPPVKENGWGDPQGRARPLCWQVSDLSEEYALREGLFQTELSGAS